MGTAHSTSSTTSRLPSARERRPPRAAALDGRDLIVAFSDGKNRRATTNGFVDDHRRLDFFDNDNDPYDASSYFRRRQPWLGPGRQRGRARQTTAAGGIGVLSPTASSCRSGPGTTFRLRRPNTLRDWDPLATNNDVSVIEGRQRQHPTTPPSPSRPPSTRTTRASSRPSPATTSTPATTTNPCQLRHTPC